MPSPNMNLPIPVPTVTPGAQYAFDEVSCFNQIDQHNHTTGQGVPIPTTGLNINASIPMNNYGLLNTQIVNLQAQVSTSIAGSIFRISDDLYYRDGSGNDVRITQSGSVAVSGAIGFTGLPSGTASASYNSFLGTFIFQSATNTGANIDGASVTIRPQTASANGVTLSAPSPLASDYTVTLFPSLPLATKFVRLDSVGALSAEVEVDNSSLEIATNTLQVKDSGITTAKINNLAVDSTKLANNAVTTAKIDSVAVTYEKRGAPNTTSVNLTGVSGVGGNATLGTLSLTTSAANSAILVTMFPHQSNGYVFSAGATDYVQFSLSGPGGYNTSYYLGRLTNGVNVFSCIFDCVAAGSYTLTVDLVIAGSANRIQQNLRVTITEYR